MESFYYFQGSERKTIYTYRQHERLSRKLKSMSLNQGDHSSLPWGSFSCTVCTLTTVY